MKENKELNNQELDSVSGGKADLEEYLRVLKEKADKPLVDYGTGTEMEPDPSVPYDDDSNAYIIKRERSPIE